MISVDEPVWATFHHAGGSAWRYPNVLGKIAALIGSNGVPNDQLLEDMWDICHQFSTYDATLAAVPHLVELCTSASPDQPIRKMLLDLIACSIECIRTDRTSATPEIENGFSLSLAQFPGLVHATMPYAKDRTELCRLCGAFAISIGDDSLGMLMLDCLTDPCDVRSARRLHCRLSRH